MARPTFHEIMMRMALLAARRSTCVRLQVGTVISSTDFRKVLSMGYNGNASGLPNTCDRTGPEAVGNCGCFIGSTPVTARSIQRAYRRRYEGLLLRIITANNDFTVTPNHPVLTLGRGLVAAELLHEGDRLLNVKRCEDISAVTPYDYNSVPIEDVYEALSVAGRRVRCAGARHQFHGDGVLNEEVDVVTVDGGLGADVESCLLQNQAQPLLSATCEVLSTFGCASTTSGAILCPADYKTRLDESVLYHDAPDAVAAGEGVRRLPTLVPLNELSEWQLCHRLALVPAEILAHLAQNPSFTQAVLNCGMRDAEALRDVYNALSTVVTADDVLHIERKTGSTHVYNLQTRSGWYSAGCERSIVQNCVHSEANAVINCDVPRSVEKIVFVTTLPCAMCAKYLINLGNVQEVFYLNDYRIRDSIELLHTVGIKTTHYMFPAPFLMAASDIPPPDGEALLKAWDMAEMSEGLQPFTIELAKSRLVAVALADRAARGEAMKGRTHDAE